MPTAPDQDLIWRRKADGGDPKPVLAAFAPGNTDIVVPAGMHFLDLWLRGGAGGGTAGGAGGTPAPHSSGDTAGAGGGGSGGAGPSQQSIRVTLRVVPGHTLR